MMRALSAWDLLNVWEWGQAQPAAQRALALLATAYPDTPPDALATLSIGERDARLLAMRELAFGPRLDSVTTCPKCGERLELSFGIADIQVQGEAASGDPPSLILDSYEISFRLPNSDDLAELSTHTDAATVRRQLLQRCLLDVKHDGTAMTFEQLPSHVVDAVVTQMAEADPQANIQLALTCPACQHRWQATFDIVSFFWTEITTWAHRILRQVHVLASAYGWREADILALSPGRRQFYLQLINR